ncbi:MAG TPA: LuxR C-terminal-related transcriptional regulator [Solirubrobacterales bacterium]
MAHWNRIRPPDCPLSWRQFQCASLLALGFTRVEIGQLLNVKASTIRTHVHQGCHRLDVNTACALAAQVAVRWMRTPRNGRQGYIDEFDRKLTTALESRHPRDHRQPRYPDLDDLIKLTLEVDGKP